MKAVGRLIVIGLTLALLTTSSFGAARVCATADVPEEFVLPDGSEHEAGKLTVCVDPARTAVQSVHTTYVNRMPVGAFTSRRDVKVASGDGQYMMLFDRHRDNKLHLSGFTLNRGSRAELYSLDKHARVDVTDSFGPPLTEGRQR